MTEKWCRREKEESVLLYFQYFPETAEGNCEKYWQENWYLFLLLGIADLLAHNEAPDFPNKKQSLRY